MLTTSCTSIFSSIASGSTSWDTDYKSNLQDILRSVISSTNPRHTSQLQMFGFCFLLKGMPIWRRMYGGYITKIEFISNGSWIVSTFSNIFRVEFGRYMRHKIGLIGKRNSRENLIFFFFFLFSDNLLKPNSSKFSIEVCGTNFQSLLIHLYNLFWFNNL